MSYQPPTLGGPPVPQHQPPMPQHQPPMPQHQPPMPQHQPPMPQHQPPILGGPPMPQQHSQQYQPYETIPPTGSMSSHNSQPRFQPYQEQYPPQQMPMQQGFDSYSAQGFRPPRECRHHNYGLGFCRLGDACRFAHSSSVPPGVNPAAPRAHSVHPSKFRTVECKYFNYGMGMCRHGDNCTFKHSPAPAPGDPAQVQQPLTHEPHTQGFAPYDPNTQPQVTRFRTKECRHFNYGRGFCSRRDSCAFRHSYPDSGPTSSHPSGLSTTIPRVDASMPPQPYGRAPMSMSVQAFKDTFG